MVVCPPGPEPFNHRALVASLLVALWTDRKPTKQTSELIYFPGWVDDDYLVQRLARLQKLAD